MVKRHKEKDEELAKQNREILLALALLQEVLGIKSPKEFEEINIKPVGWGYYTIKAREDGIYNEKGEKDAIYTELLKIGELPPYGWGFVRVHYCFTLTGGFTPPLLLILSEGVLQATKR